MKIAVYTIAKNEAKFAERWYRSTEGADVALVADTGSIDGTTKVLTNLGARVFQIGISPWRFDDARNAALALIPSDIDVCISLDMDEVLLPGWRSALEAAWTDETTIARHHLISAHHPDGSPAQCFEAVRIHTRHGYRWRHACHETLYSDRIVEQSVFIKGLEIHHYPDKNKSRRQYLDLLKQCVKEEPNSSRNVHYYARELMFYGHLNDAAKEFERHVNLPADTSWYIERCQSMQYLGKIYADLGDIEKAIFWLQRAVETAPEIRDPWVSLAEAYYRVHNWLACYNAATHALSIEHSPSGFINDPKYSGPLPHDLAAISAWNLGDKSEAAKHGYAAVSLAPDDTRLVENLRWYTGINVSF